ncbi:endodeoxyribonuclease [Rhizobium leguminosarum]|uniref:endodeoxyribonuclease n=1 Tax=Rhizobium leguminosarum TaxID=384 RepID=UPI001C97A8BE|nr:endodeoxyribonuclease [Rhizobium leguminosarum]MBY5371811.1 endodeoxyribonuclease [Rhizobium leguminosarum]
MPYRNRFEAKIAKTVPPTFAYESTRLPYTLECQYLPDWIDIHNKEIIEAKGLFDASDRRKMKAVREQYADWTITIVFQNPDAKITKQSLTSYAEWCEKNGIQWRKA